MTSKKRVLTTFAHKEPDHVPCWLGASPEWKELARAYPWPDPDWMDVSGIKSDAARWGGEFAVLGGEWSPFWHDAIDLLDFDVLIYQMFDHPDIVHAVMNHTADYYLEFILPQLKRFVASPSHDYLLAETPVENVIIMYETIREFGGYRNPNVP